MCGPPNPISRQRSNVNDDDWKIRVGLASGLPSPASKHKMEYTKLEAARLLSRTKKSTFDRSSMMESMIRQGYTPTTKRNLQALMKDHAAGNTITDDFWPSKPTKCTSICSPALDRVGLENFQYCDKAGWFRDAQGDWRSKECNSKDISRPGSRCTKCFSACKSIVRSRHPVLFGSTNKEPNNETSILPTDSAIALTITSRIKCITENEIEKDRTLKEAAGLMTMKDCFQLNLGTSKVFMVCKECHAHRICRKRSDNSHFCSKCQLRINYVKWKDKRRGQNKSLRVSPKSKVPWTSNTYEEIKVRAANAKVQRKSMKATIKRLKQKIDEQEVEKALTEELLNHMNEALEYAKNNKEKLHQSLESNLKELLKEQAKDMGTNPEQLLLSTEDTQELVECIVESMTNHIHKVNGHDNLYRFNAKTTGLAMNLLITGGPTAYKQTRDDSVVVIPGVNKLTQKRRQLRIREGDSHHWQTDQPGRTDEVSLISREDTVNANIPNLRSLAKTSQVRAFSLETLASVASSLQVYERETLVALANHMLQQGSLFELLELEYFQQWWRMSMGSPTGAWFDILLEDTQTQADATRLERFCQKIQDKLFEFSVRAVTNRSDDDSSFQYDVHSFHRSVEFTEICFEHLPGRVAEFHPGCVILGLSLSRLHSSWLKQVLRDTRKRHNPMLFGSSCPGKLTPAEENSEVNRFFGWSLFSSLERYQKDTDEHKKCRKIISQITMRERDMDDEYVEKYYDPNVAILNRGGLTLVNAKYFVFGKLLMKRVRAAYTEGMISQDPQDSFGRAQKHVLGDVGLRDKFLALCQKQAGGDEEICKKVYSAFVRKTTHARFAVVFRNWKAKNIKKNGKVDFRTKLKAGSSKNCSKKEKAAGTKDGNVPADKTKGKKRSRSVALSPSVNHRERPKMMTAEVKEGRKQKRMKMREAAKVKRQGLIWKLAFQAAPFWPPGQLLSCVPFRC
ncbi:hypothetical protein ACHAWF_010769 [Thalassiosira exigua]